MEQLSRRALAKRLETLRRELAQSNNCPATIDVWIGEGHPPEIDEDAEVIVLGSAEQLPEGDGYFLRIPGPGDPGRVPSVRG